MLLLHWFDYIYLDCFGYHQALMDCDMEDLPSAISSNIFNILLRFKKDLEALFLLHTSYTAKLCA